MEVEESEEENEEEDDDESEVEEEKPKAESVEENTEEEDGIEHEIFFGEMNLDITEEELKEFFSKCGKVNQIKLLTSYDGVSRGRGFVKFSTKSALNKALQLNATEF